jgi:hypothetical protein
MPELLISHLGADHPATGLRIASLSENLLGEVISSDGSSAVYQVLPVELKSRTATNHEYQQAEKYIINI